MVESLMAMAVAAISGTALLTSIGTAIQSSTETLNTSLAQGLAEQLMDEVSATRFPAATNVPLSAKSARSVFDDMDDFNAYSRSPPEDRNGYAIGTEGPGSLPPAMRALWMQPDASFFNGFSQQVLVERLLPNGTGWTVVSQHTDYRRVTVTISATDPRGQTRDLAQVVRVFAYSPPGI